MTMVIRAAGEPYQDANHSGSTNATDPKGGSHKPTRLEKTTLRHVSGKIPSVAYVICAAEFAERASYHGVQPLISNFVNRSMLVGGNGYGAPPRGTQQTAGALGLGSVVATAVSESFSLIAYALPLFFGYLADTKTGRFKLICYGVGVFGAAHVLMVASGAPDLLARGTAVAPFLISVYILAIGFSKMFSWANLIFFQYCADFYFKACSSPILRPSFSIR